MIFNSFTLARSQEKCRKPSVQPKIKTHKLLFIYVYLPLFICIGGSIWNNIIDYQFYLSCYLLLDICHSRYLPVKFRPVFIKKSI